MNQLIELMKLMRQAKHGVKFRIWFDPTEGDWLTLHLLLHEDWPEMKTQRGFQATITFAAIDNDPQVALDLTLPIFCEALKNTLNELDDENNG